MENPFDLTDRVALVTGGGRGIGREIVRTLARAGADIAIADLDPATASEAAAEVEALGRRGHGTRADVSDRSSVEAMVEAVVAVFGRIDILVNDAGINIKRSVEEGTPDDWLKVIDVNLNGTFWTSQAVGRKMLAQGGGSIVNIASMSGLIVNRPQLQAAYNTSKAAVIHLTKSLASEWASRGIRVNAVSPGYIETDLTKITMMNNPGLGETWMAMFPMHRMGTTADVACAVWYLASGAAAFVTGSNLVVDGGYTIW